MSVFLDTNILLYSVLRSDKDAAKQAKATALLDRDDCTLSMQVPNEFVSQATHLKRANRMTLDNAVEYVTAWRRFRVQENTLALFDAGIAVLRLGGFNFWDAMIVAAARAQGRVFLYPEDMQAGRIIDGMRIVNPFR